MINNDPNIKKKIILLIIFILITFVSEAFYREKLFEKSLEIQRILYDSLPYFIQKFNYYLSFFGHQLITLLLVIIFLVFPLNSVFNLFSCFITASFISNTLKILYGNSRPFWEIPSLKIECEGSFGNPSGHSINTWSFYLSFCDLILSSEFLKIKKNRKITFFSYVITVLFMSAICVSRILVNAHSINQVIFGSCIGFCVYFLFFKILALHTFSGKLFADFVLNPKVFKFNLFKFSCLLSVLISVYWLKKNDEVKYLKKMSLSCPNVNTQNLFGKKSLYGGLTLFFLLGFYLSLNLFFKLCKIYRPYKENEINHWNRQLFNKLPHKILTLTICMIIPGSINYLIPWESGLIIVSIFKISLPLLLLGVSMGGLFLLMIIKFKLGNSKIYDDFRVGTEADISKIPVRLPINNNIIKEDVSLKVKNIKEIKESNDLTESE